ncbi:hypothetical protein AVEN_113760-1 [Araneus ventricosus]|uniref:Uncharacterized protein n=1 Tax=Araneus ventricosus TaxID=182803 RepID=A0A4Y2U4V7_ARAVE|nr:hypothetical protein AVEN_113760-1 [Araneus ventricosus]
MVVNLKVPYRENRDAEEFELIRRCHIERTGMLKNLVANPKVPYRENRDAEEFGSVYLSLGLHTKMPNCELEHHRVNIESSF